MSNPHTAISLPKIRKVYPQLIANKLVSVQPMMQPAGLIHYLKFRYASTSRSRQDLFGPLTFDCLEVIPELITPTRRSIDDPWDVSCHAT